METEVEVITGNTSYGVTELGFVAVLLALGVALVLGAVIAYRRNMDRTITAMAVASGVIILITIVLGVMEFIPAQASGPLLMVEFGLIATLFWVWMLVECATKESSTSNDKLVWVLIILFTHVRGSALYYFVRRPQRRAEMGI